MTMKQVRSKPHQMMKDACWKNQQRTSKKMKLPTQRKTAASGKSLVLCFSVPQAIKKNILEGKFVPLLPGYEAKSCISSITDGEGSIKINTGESMKERKLGKQVLDLPQMLLALLNFKDIVGEASFQRAAELDMYIANIFNTSNKYSGKAYWFYYTYFFILSSPF